MGAAPAHTPFRVYEDSLERHGQGIDLMVFGLLIMIVTSFQPKGIIGLLGKRQPNLKGGASKDASTAA